MGELRENFIADCHAVSTFVRFKRRFHYDSNTRIRVLSCKYSDSLVRAINIEMTHRDLNAHIHDINSCLFFIMREIYEANRASGIEQCFTITDPTLTSDLNTINLS